MRVVTRLHASLAAALIFILYLSFTRDSSDLQDRIHRVWKPEAKNSPRPSSRRLVVFGDDWSDNGEYRVSPPHSSTVRNRDPDQGEMWTETLCKELACDAIDNFARSLPANVKIATIGSVVDTDIFANATAGKRDQTLALFDFRMQVQQFIQYDKEQPGPAAKEGKLDLEGKWSVFTVLFGIWDLLEYASLEKVDAVHAVDRSVEELFHNLNLLVEHLGAPIKVVIPKVVDVTFLPRFQMTKDKPDDVFANKQHESVFLWAYWNAVLSQAAAGWKGGDIFMPDLNAIVMDQVREKQLFASHTSDNSGAGKQEPLFDEVEKPCLSDAQGADVEKCSSPARHLFWDSMHLNGPAHQLIGKDAAHLVRDDKAVNRGQGADQNSNKEKVNFDLKFPPGY